MEWDDLKHFLAVARGGSLTAAATALKTSTATVARRITALERRLGARLIDRTQAGSTLTESGQAIRRRAEEVEQAVLAVEREALGRDLRPAGTVRLTTTDDIASLAVAPYLSEFARRHPEIVLELAAARDVINLSRREADIGLRTVRPTRGSFLVRQAGWWNLGLYAARTYADAHGLVPGLRSLARAAIITWTPDSAHLRGGPWFAEHARGATVVFTANSRRIHHVACKAGLGVAILPCLAADRDPDLVCLLPASRVISTELWLVVHRDVARTARVRAVMDFLVEVGPKRGR
jgi:DNA-binding transcriptional LysR family regulator